MLENLSIIVDDDLSLLAYLPANEDVIQSFIAVENVTADVGAWQKCDAKYEWYIAKSVNNGMYTSEYLRVVLKDSQSREYIQTVDPE